MATPTRRTSPASSVISLKPPSRATCVSCIRCRTTFTTHPAPTTNRSTDVGGYDVGFLQDEGAVPSLSCARPSFHVDNESGRMRHELIAIPFATLVAFGADRRATPASPPLSAISFMSGCWTGPSPNGATIEENYSAASENLLIGMSRYVRNGRVVDFEFTTVERTDSTFVMTPRPK